jgi:hypothetical protein
MNRETSSTARKGFCIFVDVFLEGSMPCVSDENGYIIFESELEAQKEIADHQMTRLREFLDGDREFEDAIQVDEFVVPVTVLPDGTIVDEAGNCFSPKPD